MAWYDKWAIMVIAAAIGVAGYNCIPWCKMDITIWAYWVAAIGTTGTLLGTIWLATAEKRDKLSRERDLALIVCAGIILKIAEIQIKVKAIGENLQATKVGETGRVKWCADMLAGLPEISFTDVAALIVLPNNVAAKVATVLTELDWCKKEITRRGNDGEIDEDIVYMCIHTGRRMIDASDRLTGYRTEIDAFLNHHECSIV